ncbi:MAG: enoyl-CoA hydratase-related protein [Myxococcota bacterium]
MTDSYETIRLDVDAQGVATLTLNRPQALNAWNGRMAVEVDRALRALDDDDAVRAVVLTGAGRAFCAGADLGRGGDSFAPAGDSSAPAGDSFASDGAERVERQERGDFPDAFWPFQMRKPVIAAINGHAIGVGITLPMTCDIRYVAEDAKIQFAFVRRGMLPELGSHSIVPKVVGLSRAADVLLSGRVFGGREAAELGLASKALPAAQVLPAALEYAREFRLAAPASVALSKRLLWEGLGVDARDMMRRELPLFSWTTGQPDAREGIVSFLEKRDPDWKLRPSRDLPEG